ncbi:hypothetical protein Cni_G28216 [Canna indica]|uniref:Uncharacterized protein n=1 Tax=Canna indica TaxID=4628 RepID=A0AAQ3L6A5_9LILI|nr:hypothetical protein Cni_G28216 [Canna indica]
MNMKGRLAGGSGVPTDLLVCFPSRAQLPMMPKLICSPSRATDSGKRHPARPANRGRASPLFKTKAKSKPMSSAEIDEPSSPKVTCAGQIKVRPKRIPRPRPSSSSNVGHWLEALGLKKEIMHFLGALRGLRFGAGCFASFHGAVVCSSDEEEEEEEEREVDAGDDSGNALSNWFKALEEKHVNTIGIGNEAEINERCEETSSSSSSAPPANALLLMRCRSAPATRRWSQRDEVTAKLKMEKEKEEEEEEERLVLMNYAPDFFKVSSEIVKETWLVGSMDPLSRSRSWKR